MQTLTLSATVVRIGIVAPSRLGTARSVHLSVTLGAVLDEVSEAVPEPYRTPAWFRLPDGHGSTVVIPPEVPRSWVAADLVGLLHTALRRRNRHLNDYGRLRLRVALDHGDVVLRPPHVGGAAVVRSAWLCDAVELRVAMAAEPGADLLLVVSDDFYAEVVAEGDRELDPAAFRQIVITAGEGLETGWLQTT
jgi:hypothetical protein